jgi:hypothetical protein
VSDHGDYKEPNSGDWMLVIERSTGEIVACMKVESVNDGIARLTDNSAWGAETGQPVTRKWADHCMWPIDKIDDYDTAADMLSTASPETFAAAYAMLLADKLTRQRKT